MRPVLRCLRSTHPLSTCIHCTTICSTQRILTRSRLPTLSTVFTPSKTYATSSAAAAPSSLTFNRYSSFLSELGLQPHNVGVSYGQTTRAGADKNNLIVSINPSTAEPIATVHRATSADYDFCLTAMNEAKTSWIRTPMPVRGGVLRALSAALLKHKNSLGALITLETGKILSEGLGEVQEAIDICDYAAGLSRSIDGQLFPSERKEHVLLERWLPLKGHVGVISAFNFPCAVFFWNLALSLLVGNTTIWKGSETTSLVSLACINIIHNTLKEQGYPASLVTLVCGDASIGQLMSSDPRIELLSFTGSTKVGRQVSQTVAARLGKTLLELGGNNGMIVMDDADQALALRATLFAAVGTAGQRCTTLRRLYLHDRIYDEFLNKLLHSYSSIRIGDPFDAAILCGPLHTSAAVENYRKGIQQIQQQGGKIRHGGRVLQRPGFFVEPTLVEISPQAACVQEELFAPVLYMMRIRDLDRAIQLHNAVPQGLSSALFTQNPATMFRWIGAEGSDCGLVNVNIGTSGAEIGGAFGGEKSTGGGRESGSDAWKNYARRATCVINYGKELPLAQGIQFV